MKQASLDDIYREIMLLSDFDQYKLYHLMEQELYQDENIVAYTTSGKPLTQNEYIEQINIGLRQIENGETITDDELEKEIATW
jgi:predicted transcriptional regulator